MLIHSNILEPFMLWCFLNIPCKDRGTATAFCPSEGQAPGLQGLGAPFSGRTRSLPAARQPEDGTILQHKHIWAALPELSFQTFLCFVSRVPKSASMHPPMRVQPDHSCSSSCAEDAGALRVMKMQKR